MCSQAMVVLPNGVGIYCSTVGELADALDVPAEQVSEDPRNFCLCNALWVTLGARCATVAEGFPQVGYVIEIGVRDA